MRNVIIDTPHRLEDDIEEFKLDCMETEKNSTAAKIKLCRDPESSKPILFYSQELSRPFKNRADSFGRRQIIKCFTPSNHSAVADTTLEMKFNDTILAHKPQIRDYNPLSDIHSDKMSLFMDEDTAQFIEDIGINVSGLGEDFQSMESVTATPFMEEISHDASKLKSELNSLKARFSIVKEQMADEFSEYVDPNRLTDEQFEEFLSCEPVSSKYVQTYLALKEQIAFLQARLEEVNSAIFSETATKIKLPQLMEGISHVG